MHTAKKGPQKMNAELPAFKTNQLPVGTVDHAMRNTRPIVCIPQVGVGSLSEAGWYGRIAFGHPTFVVGQSTILPGNAYVRENGYGEAIAYCYGLSFRIVAVH